MKHKLHLLWLLPFILLFTTQCSREEPTPPPEPVTLDYVTFNNNSSSASAEQQMLENFQEKNPHITVNSNPYRRAPSGYLLTDTPPDLLMLFPSEILFSAIGAGLVMDISDIWIEAGLNEDYPTNFQSMTEFEGKQYFMPVGYAWTGIYYNQQLFEQYGLTPPETWDGFLALCDTLLANGEIPLALGGRSATSASTWFSYLNMRLNGPDFHRSLMLGRESYADARVRNVLEMWRLLLANGYFTNPTSMDDDESITAVVRGDNGLLGRQKAAMVLTNPFDISELPEVFQSEFSFFRFPIIDSAVPVGEIVPMYGYLIPQEADDRIEALEFLSYIGSAEAQSTLNQLAGPSATFIPLHMAVEQSQLTENQQDGRTLVSTADSVLSQYYWSQPNSMRTAIERMLRHLFDEENEIDTILLNLEDAKLEAFPQ